MTKIMWRILVDGKSINRDVDAPSEERALHRAKVLLVDEQIKVDKLVSVVRR